MPVILTANPASVKISPSSENKKILDELLKPSKKGSLSYRDMKSVFEMMLVDLHEFSNVWMQYHKNLEKSVFQLWSWPQTSQLTEKINLEEAKQRLRGTSSGVRATIRSTASAIDFSDSTLHRKWKHLEYDCAEQI